MNKRTHFLLLSNTVGQLKSNVTDSLARWNSKDIQFLSPDVKMALDPMRTLVYGMELACASITYTRFYGLGDNKYLLIEELSQTKFKVTFVLVYTGNKTPKVITGFVNELDGNFLNSLFATLVMNRVTGIVNRNNTLCQSALANSGLLESAKWSHGKRDPVEVIYNRNKPGYIYLKSKRGVFNGEYSKCPKQLFNQ